MKRIPILLIATCLLSSICHAGSISIAAASDLKFAMDEIIAAYKKDNPNESINVTYGSSGKFHTQIQQGAPFDLFFSADIAFPRELEKSGFAASEVKPYAIGRIVLWSAKLDATTMTLVSLLDPGITRIAIANPRHAPYGQRAVEAIRAAGLWQKIEPKLVYGENISQAAQFVQSGNAQVGIIALSLALSPELAGKRGYYLVPQNLHQLLQQGFIITKRAEKSALAKEFAEFVSSAKAKALLNKYGFTLPETSINANQQ